MPPSVGCSAQSCRAAAAVSCPSILCSSSRCPCCRCQPCLGAAPTPLLPGDAELPHSDPVATAPSAAAGPETAADGSRPGRGGRPGTRALPCRVAGASLSARISCRALSRCWLNMKTACRGRLVWRPAAETACCNSQHSFAGLPPSTVLAAWQSCVVSSTLECCFLGCTSPPVQSHIAYSRGPKAAHSHPGSARARGGHMSVWVRGKSCRPDVLETVIRKATNPPDLDPRP